MTFSVLFFGTTALVGAAFLAWTYTKPGKKWLANF